MTYKGFIKLDIGDSFVEYLNVNDSRKHSLKLQIKGCVRHICRYLFSHRGVGHWKTWNQHTTDASTR